MLTEPEEPGKRNVCAFHWGFVVLVWLFQACPAVVRCAVGQDGFVVYSYECRAIGQGLCVSWWDTQCGLGQPLCEGFAVWDLVESGGRWGGNCGVGGLW